MKCSLGISNFLDEISCFLFCYFPLFLCIDHWGRLSSLSLLFFGTLHSDGCIFPFVLCLWLLFISQLFVRPPQTTILPFCISFSWGWSSSLPLVQCYEPPSIVLQARCLSELIPWINLSLPPVHTKFWLALQESLFPPSCGRSIIKSHWPSKSDSLGIPNPFVRSPGWEVWCGA